MTVEKNGKSYEVTETATKWQLKTGEGKVKLSYEVSKDDCATLEELRQYIADNDLF